jgi:hypothetical protein
MKRRPGGVRDVVSYQSVTFQSNLPYKLNEIHLPVLLVLRQNVASHNVYVTYHNITKRKSSKT